MWSELRRYPKSSVERLSVALAILIILVAVVGVWLAPHDPLLIDFRSKLLPPSPEHWLGTDGSGRDVLSRLLAGARLTLTSTMVVILSALVIGCTIGIASAFLGGAIDNLLMRLTDIWLGFPPLILALGFAAAMGASLEAAIWALVFSWWPNYARLCRMITRDILAQKYMASASALGVSTLRKVFRYVLPNAFDVLIIQVTLDISAVMLGISGLSFIGVGAQIPTPEWGAMISDGRSFVSNGWWIVVFPGLAIFLTALSFNVIGDMLRRELDPTSRRRQ
ncbi:MULTISPECIES: ABC transporter permease [Kaistia]|uniref:ABC transporter permease n=1 Tax=Kaistia nematophila TaxID=2994654 RepID=A0A9X3IKX9_9HYPH|nr:ABC transporter permease [Kaistia nematophila]MBN9026928.1 ABC transporter permease [Hyphomicrobiales bacterium]MCX5569943.1 ABC transporter permease [Kaistia nematophila]